MPRLLQVEFSKVIQQIADETGKEIQPALIWDTFRKEYLENRTPVDFVSHTTVPEPGHPDVRLLDAQVTFNGKQQKISGRGNGPIAGYVDALGKNCGVGIRVRDYHQHATGAGSDAQAVSFIEAETSDGRVLWGVGMDSNIVTASLKAVTSAANRSVAAK
jgi:2-isopropylmalate synthase